MRDPTLGAAARRLRRDATVEERLLWRALRRNALGAAFRRQHPIPPFIADFACIEARLVVEVDGGRRGDAGDAVRDAALVAAGWHVLRYWNNEVRGNLEGVLADVVRVLKVRMGR
ncbi:endonuclease domain-containing protein [Falsiroseomonas sp. E2-1-a20]|uniref:endonuclease domain-containing protein n=1 Tax=Falsiroseomonas sp. E2-1-a20 TaxID=3239300 RepID=UPI003F3DE0C6